MFLYKGVLEYASSEQHNLERPFLDKENICAGVIDILTCTKL